MFSDYLPLISGLALAAIAGPIGCFVVWRRMAYFGDGLSHSALLGIALGMAVNIAHEFAILLVGIAFSGFLIALRRRRLLATDTLLGLLAHATLAFGIIAMSILGAEEIDMHDYLLGSLESVSEGSTAIIVGSAIIGLILVARLWSGLVLMVTSEDLARAEGITTRWHEAGLMLILAITVAVSIQFVGVLLITSLLIIPASCGRLFSKTPEQMAVLATLFAGLCVLAGLMTAGLLSLGGHALDPGPVIVAIMVGLFAILLLVRLAFRAD